MGMKYKEIKSHNIKDFTLKKEKLIKKGWKLSAESVYLDGFIIKYEASFIKEKEKEKDKDFETFLKELDDLLMTQHRRLINITLRCGAPVDDFNNQLKFIKDIRNVMKNYEK